jgi:hypothetical protein
MSSCRASRSLLRPVSMSVITLAQPAPSSRAICSGRLSAWSSLDTRG